MGKRIRILDDTLSNQIAAGEVIERPANVLKELLENAVDARATSITVDVYDAGLEMLRVVDDGEGIEPGDLSLALRRHATSKIRRASDLWSLATLGFRGEALPSIASVSRLTLTSRTAKAESARTVVVQGGRLEDEREVGGARGTVVEVRDLFYNVPARKRFLKSRATEQAHLHEVCLRAGLAWPSVRLCYRRDGKVTREFLPVDDVRTRARLVFEGESLTEIEASRDGVTILAFLSAPERARTGATGLHLFVNQRPVRDRALSRAVAFAYGSVLPPGRFPAGVVHVKLDPSEVDVNVHPQKAEVRFARARVVLEAITRCLALHMGTQAWGSSTRSPRANQNEPIALSANQSMSADVEQTWRPTNTTESSELPFDDASVYPSLAELSPSLVPRTTVREPRPFFGTLRALGQIRSLFIVCEGDDGLHVIDQHAADERIRFHRLVSAYREKAVPTQRLLLPARLECSPADVAFADEHERELRDLGIDCTSLGTTTLAVHAVPALLRRTAPETLLRDVLDELTKTGDRAFGDAVDMALATMACHGSIRAGDSLSLPECQALLEGLAAVPEFSGHCPHGRPVVYGISFSELERRLGR